MARNPRATGYQPRNTLAERRAFFDVQRRLTLVESDTGGGGGDGDFAYTHTQSSPTSTWTITHNLGWQPNVTIVDSSGSQVEGDIRYVSATTLTATFSAAFSGVAYLS